MLVTISLDPDRDVAVCGFTLFSLMLIRDALGLHAYWCARDAMGPWWRVMVGRA